MKSPTFPAIVEVATHTTDRLEPFHTPTGRAFADVVSDGHQETWPVQSKNFRRWAGLTLYKIIGKTPSQAELTRQIVLLEAEALHPAMPGRNVHVWAACANGHIYIDLADNDWNVIEIGPHGWRLTHNLPVRFIRLPGMTPLPMPTKDGSIDGLRSFVNLRDDSGFVLLVGWLDALRHDGGHPVLVLSVAEGTAKSTLQYLLAFDNVCSVSPQTSDALCRLATGRNANPIVINGLPTW